LLNKYLKCSVWRLALRYDIYIYMSLGFRRLGALTGTSSEQQLDRELGVFLLACLIWGGFWRRRLFVWPNLSSWFLPFRLLGTNSSPAVLSDTWTWWSKWPAYSSEGSAFCWNYHLFVRFRIFVSFA